MAFNPRAMASNLVMASNPKAMASKLVDASSDGPQPKSDGLQPKSDGLQPSDLVAMDLRAMASNSRAMASSLIEMQKLLWRKSLRPVSLAQKIERHGFGIFFGKPWDALTILDLDQQKSTKHACWPDKEQPNLHQSLQLFVSKIPLLYIDSTLCGLAPTTARPYKVPCCAQLKGKKCKPGSQLKNSQLFSSRRLGC